MIIDIFQKPLDDLVPFFAAVQRQVLDAHILGQVRGVEDDRVELFFYILEEIACLPLNLWILDFLCNLIFARLVFF